MRNGNTYTNQMGYLEAISQIKITEWDLNIAEKAIELNIAIQTIQNEA